MSYARYLDAEHRINQGLIRLGLSLQRGEAKPTDPVARMGEMRSFLKKCNNPQQGIPAVHVAGTSGKGSVAAGIAGILTEAGLRIGLHVSPYLQSATEKIWIADRFVSSDEFADLVDWVMPVAAPLVRPETRASIHGMASVAVAFEAFRRQEVDAVVFEAGCGGRFDLTSFVQTRVGVITNVGMDHVISLGPTLEQIAWHKAGIARPGATLVTGAEGAALDIIKKEADQVGCPVVPVTPGDDPLDHNRAIAARAAFEMAKALGVEIDSSASSRGLDRVVLAGRSEVMPASRGPYAVLDGAHNENKLAVAVRSALGRAGKGPRVAVIGFLGTKAKPQLAGPFMRCFDEIIATEPSVYGKLACPAAQTADLLASAGLSPILEPDMFAALDRAMEAAGKDGTVLATGSFYLVGPLRERWFPKERVVLERTSWPRQSGNTDFK